MFNIILNGIFWVFAIYGFLELIRNIICTYTYTNLKQDGIYCIIAAKNQEKKIEGFVRSFLFKLIYGNEKNIKEVIMVDLNSNDETKKIIDKLEKDYGEINVSSWRDCKELIDRIDEVK